MDARQQAGFTLYELLITVLVIGVILTIGLPNMREFTANSRISATANDLHGALMLGRTEAARAREEVTICASSNGTACNSADFDTGWIVFVDGTGDGNGVVDGTDTVLRIFPAVDPSINVNATDLGGNPASRFTFTPASVGTGAAGMLTAATICDGRGNRVAAGGWSTARLLIVTPLGRSTVLRDAVQIANRGGCP